MMEATIYQQYKTQSLETLTGGELVVKLFEEASKQIGIAIFLTNQHNAAKAYDCIAKAQKIITTLEFSLDMKLSYFYRTSQSVSVSFQGSFRIDRQPGC